MNWNANQKPFLVVISKEVGVFRRISEESREVLIVAFVHDVLFRDAEGEEFGLDIVDHFNEAADIKRFGGGVGQKRGDVILDIPFVPLPKSGRPAQGEQVLEIRITPGQRLPFFLVKNVIVKPISKQEIDVLGRLLLDQIIDHASNGGNA